MAHASDKRNVIPALCEITVDTRLLPGQTPEEAEATIRGVPRRRRLRARQHRAQGGTRSPIGGPLWDAVQSFVEAEEPGAVAAPDLRRGLHRLALAARGVRHGRLRLLPVARDGLGDRRPAHPLGGRARPRRGPRARRALAAPRRAVRLRVAMLELYEPAGAFEQLAEYVAASAAVDATSSSATASPSRSAATTRRPRRSRAGCRCWQRARPALVRTPHEVGSAPVSGSRPGRRRLRGGDRRGARGDRARRRLPGEPRAAPERAVRGDPRALVARARAAAPAARPCRSTGDGWAIVSASPELFLARRGDLLCTRPIKGTRPAGEDVDDDEGRRRARDDRRPRAQRPLARLRAGHGALARADAPARARRRDAPRRRPSRGGSARGRDARRDPATRRSPAARSPARRRSPRSTTSRGSSRSGAARRWARSGRSTRTATSSSR